MWTITGISTKNNYILTNHLIETMNVTIVPTYRSSWDYYNETINTYNGLIGDLQSGLAEIGGTPSFITIDRLKIVDLTVSTTKTYLRFIYRDPPLTYVTNIFTLPFDTYVWYACFVVFGVVMVATYVIVYWEWKDPIFSETLNYHDFIAPLKPDISEICIAEVALITQQGTECEPKSNGGRIATFFSMLSLMFLYSAYSANIVALLQSTTDNIRTLEDIYNSRMKLGVEDIVYAHYFFESVTDPLRKQIYDQKIAPKGQKSNFMKIEEGIARMKSEFFAFHVEPSRGYKVVADTFKENEKCGIREFNFFPYVVSPWSLARKNTTYREIIKTNMKRIAESGLQQREYVKIYTKKPVCQSQSSNFGSVGLIDCYALFLIFGIGIAVSVILLIIEIIFKRLTRNLTNE
ncbi:glutamate receptor ionotropic, kainate glr-3-like [Aethina tumida]|uniref:glutamate receptor ionotropic, kainate glr-3-like n=1 Tax=Aethina tumida TaxID=116153 RepID=UPI0021485449|nr:glutamate receptor ionotropic, kainate glr-3-like [Aethina tumida]